MYGTFSHIRLPHILIPFNKTSTKKFHARDASRINSVVNNSTPMHEWLLLLLPSHNCTWFVKRRTSEHDTHTTMSVGIHTRASLECMDGSKCTSHCRKIAVSTSYWWDPNTQQNWTLYLIHLVRVSRALFVCSINLFTEKYLSCCCSFSAVPIQTYGDWMRFLVPKIKNIQIFYD